METQTFRGNIAQREAMRKAGPPEFKKDRGLGGIGGIPETREPNGEPGKGTPKRCADFSGLSGQGYPGEKAGIGLLVLPGRKGSPGFRRKDGLPGTSGQKREDGLPGLMEVTGLEQRFCLSKKCQNHQDNQK
ncbi:hypothetical protein GCK72_022859 [Caenorhabditis remanei]|uniref:Uncharacterized protein n=1 Tax=Caenorhabditis remanei TaxID=31234 RepID=A0A6A5FV73_CAERE|nr:hypothetical protein GCK72_022859 [Caenorhabditis remanei]KAF1746405.1 hypothetical protein GCK72_022859 [Caenorhabditis remanei]